MNCSRLFALETLAASLVSGATMELYLTPKPGLVDRADSGSHSDLSLLLMERSIAQLSDYLEKIVSSLAGGEGFAEQRRIGRYAEQRLLATLGTNTHKGFIFLSGMLLIAQWNAASADEKALRATLSGLAGDFFGNAGENWHTGEKASNGEQARKQYRSGGIVAESIEGFPSIFDAALPAFRASMQRKRCLQAASFAMLARLMQTVDDTTALHRAGLPGLARIKNDGRRLEMLLAEDGDYLSLLADLNREYIRTKLTMGGVADMLGLAFGCLIANGEIVAQDALARGRAEAASG